ncbi:MAG: MOSC N-terminal beta barrel domain-containing protein [Chloroflexota bacterium]|nr:MOSC N-terminal beta barrel domain-containing protein [Chloroflexota bacterium]
MQDLEESKAKIKMLEQAAVVALFYYPIKSCGGRQVEQAEIDECGLKHDRELMLVDPATGAFITQRELPQMALIRPQIEQGLLRLEAPGMPVLELALVTEGVRLKAVVWSDQCDTVDQGDEVADWLGEFLRRKCRLVRMAPGFRRSVKPKYAQRAEDQVNFADGFPFLLASEESLTDLNQRLLEPLPMNRFRPNIVIAGSGLAYGEDFLKRITVGQITFRVVKPCVRCVITTTDQETAQRNKEPLKTLATYRQTEEGGVWFAQNLIHENLGTIGLGDKVKVLELK